MSQPTHTPGPVDLLWEVDGHEPDNIIVRSLHDGLNFGICEVFEREANARLLAAAYNAFDSAAKKLGLNAVEFAERMADGGLADLVIAFEECLPNVHGHSSGDHAGRPWLQKARAALVKVRADAA